MQNNNLLKKAMLALLLCVAMPTLNAQVHVGDILCEGDLIYPPSIYPSSGAAAIGVVFYVDNTGQHGWALALEDAGNYTWGSFGSDTPMPNYANRRQAIYDLDGYNNTRIIREHSTDHPAFYAIDFENGWYVPAIGQLNYLYGNLVEVNKSLTLVDGMVFPVTEWTCWSSTEISNYHAWALRFHGDFDDNPYNWGKDYSCRVRPVRNF
jgi:hypothetical protein